MPDKNLLIDSIKPHFAGSLRDNRQVSSTLPALQLLFFLSIFLPLTVSGEPKPSAKSDPALKAAMDTVYSAYKEIQPFLVSQKRFGASENHKQISGLLHTLRAGFHTVESFDGQYSEQPGFNANLNLMNQALEDAENRFKSDRKRWSYWRLKTASQNCITCHTTYKVELSFNDRTPPPAGLTSFELGEFFVASRQFNEALDAFYKAAQDRKLGADRFEALKQWLVIRTRVNPEPAKAVLALRNVVRVRGFTHYELEQISEWVTALNSWASEKPGKADDLRKAENLLRQAAALSDPLLVQSNAVEILRASSLLHNLLAKKNEIGKKERAKALYLLGLSYAKLPSFFANELSEFFLERCIRENPKTMTAKRAYTLYRDIVSLGFTGSSGTNLPNDVQLRIRELHDLAYGVMTMGNQ